MFADVEHLLGMSSGISTRNETEKTKSVHEK